MSIFRSEHSGTAADISAYHDDELSPAAKRAIAAQLASSPARRRELDRLQRVSDSLGTGEVSRHEIEVAAERVRERLNRSLRGRHIGGGIWSRRVRIPMPLVAAAAGVMVALSAAVVVLAWPRDSAQPYTVADLTDSDRNLNLEVHVDSLESEALLRWLTEQGRLEQVTIQLPDQVEFQRRGEPVLLRRSEENAEEELEIVPMSSPPEAPR